MKRIAFLFGIGLLALAFLVTGAELATRTILSAQDNGARDVFVSTRLVWRTIAPHSFLLLHSSAIWPLVKHLLMLPGWVLFGLPGLTLVIGFRPHRGEDLTISQDQAHQDALYLFDELALAAQKDTDRGLADDRDPSDHADLVLAEDHYAADLSPAELAGETTTHPAAQRDFLLNPAKPVNSPD